MLVTVVATVVGSIFCAFWLFPRILPDIKYPVWMLAIPIVGIGVGTAALGQWLFKLLGIKIYVPVERSEFRDAK